MKNILFVGASGYGNLGDDAYKILFSKYLINNYNLFFDSPFPDTSLIPNMDALVIGGGGLIYDNRTDHFNYMKMYMDVILKLKKPLYFSSCGVQLMDLQQQNIKDETALIQFGVKQLQRWKPFLLYAKSISVRSEMDLKIVKALDTNINAFYYPDLAYLLMPSKYHLIKPDSYVFIPTPSGYKNEKFQGELVKALRDISRRVYFIAFSRDDYEIVTGLADKVDSRGNYATRLYISPEEACSIIQDAYKVITNRYHGAIFARAVNKPEQDIIVADTRYKSVVEIAPTDKNLALNHINLLTNI